MSAETLSLLCYNQVRLGHELGAAKAHLTTAKNKLQVVKLSVNTADTDLRTYELFTDSPWDWQKLSDA
eukprot:COSAG05_NODE_43_length_25931_cov_49.314636_6_plen_68_part_00